MVTNLLAILLAYFTGVVVTAFVCHPMRNWEEGYFTAKQRYTDWNKGFDDGFKAGWKCAMNEKEKING